MDQHQVLVVYWIQCYRIITFETIIVRKTSSCVVISLTCCNFSNVIIRFHTTFNWDIKKVFFDQLEHCIPLFIILEDCILCILFYLFDFQTIKQKVLFTLWKLESINESKYWFCICAEAFGLYLFQLIVFLNQI